METQHDILVQNKRDIQFKISINRKITVIRGDSATGKTTLFQMVSDANISAGTGVNIACDVPVVALYETGYKYQITALSSLPESHFRQFHIVIRRSIK